MPGTEEVKDELMDDIFSAAFDEKISGKEPEETKDEEAATKAAEEAEKKAAEEAAAAEKAAEEAAAAKASEPDPEVIALKAQLEETNRKIKEREEAEAAAKAAEEAAKKDIPDPAEQEAWEKFKADWPDQAKIIEKERAARAAEISELKKIVNDLSVAVKAQLDPVVASVAETEQDKFMQPILSAHPDTMDLWESGKIKQWIEKQPQYLQAGYNFAFTDSRATPQDVIAVVTAMKEATGLLKKDDGEAEKAAVKAAEEARLKKMEIPTGVRTSVTAEEDADDFDTAFDQAMKKIK